MNKERLSKDLFLAQLEQLLYDIPKEEREEAMDYYRSYFDDAGAENEAAVIEELDSPQKIAQGLKEELNSAGNMTSFLKNPPQVRDAQPRKKQGARKLFFGSDFEKEDMDMGSTTGQEAYGSAGGQDASASAGSQDASGQGAYGGADRQGASGAAYRRYSQYDTGTGQQRWQRRGQRMDRHAKFVLFVILAVFTSPIWGTAVSGIFGVVGVAIASVVLLGIFSLGGVVGGIACTVAGIVKLCMLSMLPGLSMVGVGMLLIAASGIGIVLLLLLCGRFIPWAAATVVQLFRRLWNWGRSMA